MEELLDLDGRFDIEEIDVESGRAVINYSYHPLFDGVFDGPWYLDFDDDELTWDAIEYENEDDMHGEVVMSGKIVDKKLVANWSRSKRKYL